MNGGAREERRSEKTKVSTSRDDRTATRGGQAGYTRRTWGPTWYLAVCLSMQRRGRGTRDERTKTPRRRPSGGNPARSNSIARKLLQSSPISGITILLISNCAAWSSSAIRLALYTVQAMARPTRARRAAPADPAPASAPTSTDGSGGVGGPAPLRKRSHADALGPDGADSPAIATATSEIQQRRSKRGKTAARDEAREPDPARSGFEAAPHAVAVTAAANSASQPDTSARSATSIQVGVDAAPSAPDREPTEMVLDPRDPALAIDALSAQERRALKGKGRATEDQDELMLDGAPASDLAGLQKELAARDEVGSAFCFSPNARLLNQSLCRAHSRITAYRFSDGHPGIRGIRSDVQRLPRTARPTTRSSVRSRLVRCVTASFAATS